MGGMKKAIGLGEKIGAIQKVEPQKKVEVETKIENDTDEDRVRQAKRKGRRYSIKTSAAGLTETPTTKKTLLGG